MRTNAFAYMLISENGLKSLIEYRSVSKERVKSIKLLTIQTKKNNEVQFIICETFCVYIHFCVSKYYIKQDPFHQQIRNNFLEFNFEKLFCFWSEYIFIFIYKGSFDFFWRPPAFRCHSNRQKNNSKKYLFPVYQLQ